MGKREPHPGKKHKRPQEKLRGKANLWGVHAVRAAWLNPARTVRAFYATGQALGDFGKTMEDAQAAGILRPEPEIRDRQTLDRMLPPGAVHQGLAVDAAPLGETFIQDMAVKADMKGGGILLMLDQVTDPHNVGAIMRSACAFGADGIVMQSRHAPEIGGVLAKAACGAVEHVPVAHETNLGRALAYLKSEGFTAVGLDERAEKTIARCGKPQKTVILLGAEGKGLRQNLRESCDMLARLPTYGPIASLNVSNAAAVALYALSSE